MPAAFLPPIVAGSFLEVPKLLYLEANTLRTDLDEITNSRCTSTDSRGIPNMWVAFFPPGGIVSGAPGGGCLCLIRPSSYRISPSRDVYFVDVSSFSRRERVPEYGFSAILRDLQLFKMCRNVRLLKSQELLKWIAGSKFPSMHLSVVARFLVTRSWFGYSGRPLQESECSFSESRTRTPIDRPERDVQSRDVSVQRRKSPVRVCNFAYKIAFT